jgi:uncharacterized membrane protein YoaT (DUF817 family)
VCLLGVARITSMNHWCLASVTAFLILKVLICSFPNSLFYLSLSLVIYGSIDFFNNHRHTYLYDFRWSCLKTLSIV